MRAMKDSGVEWIGEIPEGWMIKPLSALFSERKNKNKGCIESNVLSLSYGHIVRRNVSNNMGLLPENFDTYNIVEPENIVLRLTDLQNDQRSLRVGFVKECGIITSAYLTLENIVELESKYYFFMLYIYDVMKIIYNMGNGVRQNLKFSELAKLPLLVPALLLQQRIATFLDTKCAQIDAIIEKQQQVIEKLKAYKQSVITEAVTKGLDPTVPMKNSGVEWIGMVPAFATVTTVGRLFTTILGKMLCDQPIEGATLEPYFCAANVHFDGIDYSTLKQMWFTPSEKTTYKVHNGDLLVVEGGAGAGGAYVITDICCDVYIQNSIHIVRPISKHGNCKYLYYTLMSLIQRQYIDFVSNKATIPHFTKEKLHSVPVVFFPHAITTNIVAYLDKRCNELDGNIEKKEHLIDKLVAYKKSLIYEAVTGKMEV